MTGPNFVGVGMQKSGTRWLYTQLRGHPDFWMPPLKEFQFFRNTFPGAKALGTCEKRLSQPHDAADGEFLRRMLAMERRSDQPIEVYRSLFEPAQGRLTGEITPTYSGFSPEAVAGIRTKLGPVQVILIVRDPVERAWSALNDGVNDGHFDPASVTDPGLMGRTLDEPRLADISHPSRTHAAWSRHFPVKVAFYEDVVERPEALREELAVHLGARAGAAWRNDARRNPKAGRARAPLTPVLREALVGRFRDEVLASAEAFGGPAAAWPAKHGLA